MDIPLADLAREVGGVIDGDPSVRISGFAGLQKAGPGDLTFLRAAGKAADLHGARAAAVIVAPEIAAAGLTLLKVAAPERAFNRLSRVFGPRPPTFPAGVHPTAVVDRGAQVDPTAAVGPFVVIEAGASIGPRTQIGAHGYVGHNVRVGADCRLFPRVVLREESVLGDRVVLDAGVVIGSDGFGWEPGPSGARRIPQLGRVVIEDDVEIGANSTVDRARLDETRVGRGSKLDNLVHLGHNVEVGAFCMFAAQVGLAGTTIVGEGVEMGGQAGIAGHVRIGDGARIGAQSGIMRSVAPGSKWLGSPALPLSQAKRVILAESVLPDLVKRVKKLEEKVARFEDAADS